MKERECATNKGAHIAIGQGIWVVDPKAQITADEAQGKEPQQKEESAAPKKKVTSQMLPNKFQRDQERRQYREASAR